METTPGPPKLHRRSLDSGILHLGYNHTYFSLLAQRFQCVCGLPAHKEQMICLPHIHIWWASRDSIIVHFCGSNVIQSIPRLSTSIGLARSANADLHPRHVTNVQTVTPNLFLNSQPLNLMTVIIQNYSRDGQISTHWAPRQDLLLHPSESRFKQMYLSLETFSWCSREVSLLLNSLRTMATKGWSKNGNWYAYPHP